MKSSKSIAVFGLFTGLGLATLMLGIASLKTKPAFAHHCGPFDPTCSHNGCSDLDPTCNPNVKKITKPLSEEAWGQAGSQAYEAAANIMRLRNPSMGLSSETTHHGLLRSRYGNLINQTRIVYNARTMDQWCALGICVDPNTDAQAFCDTIYVSDRYKPNDSAQLGLLAHEFRHIEQCRRLGGVTRFGYHYFREYKKANQDYSNNSMEISAQNAERMFLTNIVCPLVGCPPRSGEYHPDYNGWGIDLPVSIPQSSSTVPLIQLRY